VIDWRQRKIPGRLAAARKHRGISQERTAAALGMSLSTYRRWEKRQTRRPMLAYYVNAAHLFDVPLTSLIDDEYLEWTVLDPDTPRGPNHDLYRTNPNRPNLPPAP
jgi:transcriptional regulator with XRE-family HTH domain